MLGDLIKGLMIWRCSEPLLTFPTLSLSLVRAMSSPPTKRRLSATSSSSSSPSTASFYSYSSYSSASPALSARLSSRSPSDSDSNSDSNSDSSSSDSTGLTNTQSIGILIGGGCFILLLAIFLLFWFCWKKPRVKKISNSLGDEDEKGSKGAILTRLPTMGMKRKTNRGAENGALRQITQVGQQYVGFQHNYLNHRQQQQEQHHFGAKPPAPADQRRGFMGSKIKSKITSPPACHIENPISVKGHYIPSSQHRLSSSSSTSSPTKRPMSSLDLGTLVHDVMLDVNLDDNEEYQDNEDYEEKDVIVCREGGLMKELDVDYYGIGGGPSQWSLKR